jgi:hypothetical protein
MTKVCEYIYFGGEGAGENCLQEDYLLTFFIKKIKSHDLPSYTTSGKN